MVHVANSSRPKVWSGVFILTIVITFFAFVAGQGLNTGMSVYVEHQGGTATFAGLLMAVFSASAAVSRIVVGPAIDTRGRRTIMVAGSGLSFKKCVYIDRISPVHAWKTCPGS